MIYKTIVIDNISKAKKLALAIEKKANEMAPAAGSAEEAVTAGGVE